MNIRHLEKINLYQTVTLPSKPKKINLRQNFHPERLDSLISSKKSENSYHIAVMDIIDNLYSAFLLFQTKMSHSALLLLVPNWLANSKL